MGLDGLTAFIEQKVPGSKSQAAAVEESDVPELAPAGAPKQTADGNLYNAEDSQSRLVLKAKAPVWVRIEDARGNVAKLTPAGLAKLRKAWPAHLASVRDRVFDQVEPGTVSDAAQALSEIAAKLEAKR